MNTEESSFVNKSLIVKMLMKQKYDSYLLVKKKQDKLKAIQLQARF